MSHKSHYDLLDITEDASDKDVREAFKGKVREHPPEQDPEGYKLLREAYDILSNPVARREYDNLSEFGDRIEQLQEEANEILQSEEPDYDRAVQLLKQAVVLGPDIGILRDMLGNCYLRNEQPDQALKQFEKAVTLDPSNRSYRLHKGYALKNLEQLDDAESLFRSLWKEDKEDYEAGRALASTLTKKEQFDEALSVLDETILADGQEDFEDFFCYYDKLYLYIIIDNTCELEKTLEKVKSLTKSPDDKRFASFMLADMSEQLYSANRFSIAHRFIEAASALLPNDYDLNQLASHAKNLRNLQEGAREIYEDDDFHDFVKHMVSVTVAASLGEIEPRESQSYMSDIAEVLENMLTVDPFNTEVKEGVRRIKWEYEEIYNINPSLYEVILSFGPAAMVQRPCPYCSEAITTDKYEKGIGSCPSCGRRVSFSPLGFSKSGSYSKSLSATGSSTSKDSRKSSSSDRYSESTTRTSRKNKKHVYSTALDTAYKFAKVIFFIIFLLMGPAVLAGLMAEMTGSGVFAGIVFVGTFISILMWFENKEAKEASKDIGK